MGLENRAGVGCHPQACPWGPTHCFTSVHELGGKVSASPTLNIVQFAGAIANNYSTALQPLDMLVCSCWSVAAGKKCPK